MFLRGKERGQGPSWKITRKKEVIEMNGWNVPHSFAHRGEKQKKGGQCGPKLVGRVMVPITCVGLQNPISTSIYFAFDYLGMCIAFLLFIFIHYNSISVCGYFLCRNIVCA